MSRQPVNVIDRVDLGVQANQQARAVAEQWAAAYVDAVASDVPFDTAPGAVDLIYGASVIQDQLMADRSAAGLPVDEHDAALRAGYLLGVAIGRRMPGGAR